MDARFIDLITALERGDLDGVKRWRSRNELVDLPDEVLTPEAMPTNPDWEWPSIVQDFALLFNGYAWAETNDVKLEALFEKVKSGCNAGTVELFTLTELRAALFYLQRLCRQVCEDPDPVLVKQLLEAIRRKIANPLQIPPNFVRPDGSLTLRIKRNALLMGNRGGLGPVMLQRPQPYAAGKPWIACVLKENGNELPKTKVAYTKLFFLDEVTAFAAGHRPCGQCQTERYEMFLYFWKKYVSKDTTTFDDDLHRNRCDENGNKVVHEADLEKLPSGVIVRLPDSEQPYLLLWGKLFPWSEIGYGSPVVEAAKRKVIVLTPSLIVQMLQKGFPLLVNREETIHPSILDQI